MFPSLSKKPPVICGTYHQKMVYVVSWGPPILCEGESSKPFKPLICIMYLILLSDNISLIMYRHFTTHTSQNIRAKVVQSLDKLFARALILLNDATYSLIVILLPLVDASRADSLKLSLSVKRGDNFSNYV